MAVATADIAAVLDHFRQQYLKQAQADVARLRSLQSDALLFLSDAATTIDGAANRADRARRQLQAFTAIDQRLTDLKRDFASVLLLAMVSSSQIAADQQSELETLHGMAVDPLLVANQTRRGKLSDGSEVVVIFGSTADNAARTSADRAYSDGLRLPDRLAQMDAQTRAIVSQAILDGTASGLTAGQVAERLREALTAAGVSTPLYRAERLAITEVNNAYRLATVMAALQPGTGELKPGILGLRWTLSAAHSVPDICDDHAANSSPGLPAGVYLPGDVPDEHPNGLCYLVPEFAG